MKTSCPNEALSDEPQQILSLVDTHAHLDMDIFQPDLPDLLTRCRNGVFPEIQGKTIPNGPVKFEMKAMILPGIHVNSSRRVLEVTEGDSLLFPAVGIHPNYTVSLTDADWQTLVSYAENERVVGIGETGLDRHWDYSPIEIQKEYFRRHIELARRRNVPIIIHCREAEEDLLAILRESYQADGVFSGIIHSFCGDIDMASECLEMGFHLGFGGSLTYSGRKSIPVWQAMKIVPSDRFVLETDCPFLTPYPFRGKLERNEPLMTAFTARKLSELREEPIETIVRQTTENALKLFRIGCNSENG